MKLGVVNEDIWDFFHEVYADFQAHYQTALFQRKVFSLPAFNERVNRYLLHRDMQAFMKENDVLFFEWAGELLALASRLPKRCGIVVRMHRYDMYKWIDAVNWAAVDRIILVSEAKRREFSSHYPHQADKIVVIPEAVSLERFPFRPKPYNGDLGILCHLKPRKRVYDLVLAFYELTQKADGLHLYIGGDRRPRYLDYYRALQALVRTLGLEKHVTFEGHVADPKEWYHKIDIFISNSYSEGLQVSPMEAMASGCYCLSHRWEGAEELLPEENLFFTGGEMVQKVLRYCNSSEAEKEKMRGRLRTLVEENFDVDKTKVEIRHLVEEVGGKWQTGA